MTFTDSDGLYWLTAPDVYGSKAGETDLFKRLSNPESGNREQCLEYITKVSG
jgi:hypothetical protein